ncbi:hypothetical protein TanjilG_25596 [Lupinus angustifolius]|uniref:Uncharacterized protein n=1 Tax=Lupinus angustifolius TaxID=3871 RepID=A0A4P1QTL8_LUPAN|nr:hypothetical protein TanjilG_25596 [Lupinus angustifolius]
MLVCQPEKMKKNKKLSTCSSPLTTAKSDSDAGNHVGVVIGEEEEVLLRGVTIVTSLLALWRLHHHDQAASKQRRTPPTDETIKRPLPSQNHITTHYWKCFEHDY